MPLEPAVAVCVVDVGSGVVVAGVVVGVFVVGGVAVDVDGVVDGGVSVVTVGEVVVVDVVGVVARVLFVLEVSFNEVFLGTATQAVPLSCHPLRQEVHKLLRFPFLSRQLLHTPGDLHSHSRGHCLTHTPLAKTNPALHALQLWLMFLFGSLQLVQLEESQLQFRGHIYLHTPASFLA